MVAGIAGLQAVENRLLPPLLMHSGVAWLLECAPVSAVSPAISLPRHRLLFEDDLWVWPFRAQFDRLPLATAALPALLIRHLFWTGSRFEMLDELVRVLKPGGLLVSVSLNPWHRAAWRIARDRRGRLPAWPVFLWLHRRLGLMVLPGLPAWRQCISPLLVIVARKPPQAIGRQRALNTATVHRTARAGLHGGSC
ncbi:MAG: hypothetical protein Kow0020_05630 [Wenzhouxiangellaceae bacterium]